VNPDEYEDRWESETEAFFPNNGESVVIQVENTNLDFDKSKIKSADIISTVYLPSYKGKLTVTLGFKNSFYEVTGGMNPDTQEVTETKTADTAEANTKTNTDAGADIEADSEYQYMTY
jgi:hypothetical protein